MLLHVAQNSCFIQVCGDDIVSFLADVVLNESLLQSNGETDGFEGHHEVLLSFQDAGEVIESQYLQFG